MGEDVGRVEFISHTFHSSTPQEGPRVLGCKKYKTSVHKRQKYKMESETE